MRSGDTQARRVLLLVLMTLTIAATQTSTLPSRAQDFARVRGKQPIPRDGYKTWSLFLVAKQDWLIPENAGRLRQLYERSEAFGRVIGREHLAVWFWKQDMPLASPVLAENVDVERAAEYCRLLGRKPSEGPFLVFTTVYPDEHSVPESYQVISLQGRSSEEIGLLLEELGDQLKMEGVVREGKIQPLPADDFWSAWFDATRHALVKLKSAICFAIRTPSLSIEVGCKREVG